MGQTTVKEVQVKKRAPAFVNKNRTIPEMFDVVRELESNEDKVNVLKAYNTKALRYVINGMYNVDWTDIKIPKVKLNHRPPEICNKGLNTVLTDLETVYKVYKTKPEVADRILTKVLEEVSAREAELIVDMMKGKKVQGISKSIFKKAYPAFFREEAEDQTV